MSTALSQPTLDLQASPSVCDGRKFTQVDHAVLFGACSSKTPYCTSRDLLAKAAQHRIWPRVSLRHLNRWRARWQLSRAKGRPCGVSARVTVSAGRAVVCVTPRLSFVGVHLFASLARSTRGLGARGGGAPRGDKGISTHASGRRFRLVTPA